MHMSGYSACIASSPWLPKVKISVSRPWSARIFSSAYSESFSASSLMGRTMPLVPSTDSPPTMPRRGLKVFFAISRPPGMEIVTCAARFGYTLRTASAIICRGTGLIAA